MLTATENKVKTLIRYEPFKRAYMMMDEGQFYAIGRDEIQQLLSKIDNYKPVENGLS